MRTPALERAIRRSGEARRPAVDPCGLCATPLVPEHVHLLDLETRRPVCACGACALLFDRPADSGGRYRLIPNRRLRLDGLDPGVLGTPVGLAFFVLGDDGEVAAHYPSPAGATRSELDASDWAAAVATCPELAEIEPEVEALVVDTSAGASAAFLVSLSECYRLVGRVRTCWEGWTGGEPVRRAIEEFFDELGRSDGTHQSR